MNAEFDRIRIGRHVEAAIAEFVEIPKGAFVLGHELAHKAVYAMFDGQRSGTKVSGQSGYAGIL
jgi:hypothetical protein